MKIAFLFPRFKYPSGDPPIGLLQIAANVRKKTHVPFDWLDTSFEPNWDILKRKLQQERYDLLGIYCMTSMLDDVSKAAKIAKEVSPKTRILVGGPHPTVMPLHALEIVDVDAVCVGEGEETVVELIEKNLCFRDVRGIFYKKDGEIVENPPRPVIADLDELPFPAYDLLDSRYFDEWFAMDFVKKGLRATSIISSRGCPASCTYCQPTLSTMFGKKIRKMSPKRIVELLEWLKNEFRLTAFAFVDDTLLFDKSWVREICGLLIEKKLGMIFSCNTRANLVDEEIIGVLYEAGLRKIFMGIESGSQRVLDEIYKKGTTLEQVHNAVSILKARGIIVQGYFMLGAPTETEDEVLSTIANAVSLNIDEATFSIATPLPKTYLYDMTRDGIAADLSEFDYYSKPVYRDGITLASEKLVALKRKAFLKFYLAPKRLPNTIGSFLSVGGIRKNLNKLKRF